MINDPLVVAQFSKQKYIPDKRKKPEDIPVLRFYLIKACFVLCYFVVGISFIKITFSSVPQEVQEEDRMIILSERANITDRNGHILATNIATHALYAEPIRIIDPKGTAQKLIQIFPDMNQERLERTLGNKKTFAWLRQKLSPEQLEAVNDIGEPGLAFGPREMRFYPNGSVAAHVLGGYTFQKYGVHSAELGGAGGVELRFNSFLIDPKNEGKPLVLSLDKVIQDATELVLEGGMRITHSKAAVAVLMDTQTGEILALSSKPDFDPNHRPRALPPKEKENDPLFNRAVHERYELGSVFKLFTLAQALELELIAPDTLISTQGPLKYGGFTIKATDKHPALMSVADIIAKSSNTGTARIALKIGPERQRLFLDRLGLLKPSPVEISGATRVYPAFPEEWTDTSTVTISYGHGIAVSVVHLAAAYSSILNGGKIVRPTILKQESPPNMGRIVSERVSAQAREILRKTVLTGTGTEIKNSAYSIAGKTGTADKPSPDGDYYEDQNLSTFACVFPAEDPRYVLVVMLDDPHVKMGKTVTRTASLTAVPVAGALVQRIAPLLGVSPEHPKTPRILALEGN